MVVYKALPPDSVDRDHGEKVDGSFTVSSVRHHLIVDPVRRAIVHHRPSTGDPVPCPERHARSLRSTSVKDS